MASSAPHDSDDDMDEFMEKFRQEKYKNAFNESNWEEEFDKVPMFMKTAPEEIDPTSHPDLACIQSLIHDDMSPEEHATSLKDEGNEYFKEKNYKKAILSYTAGLKKNCADQDINTVLLTNRAAAHFRIGNMRSALNDATSAKKIKPNHLKALIRGRTMAAISACKLSSKRKAAADSLGIPINEVIVIGAQCCMALKSFAEAIQWCDAGLEAHPTDKNLQEIRTAADKQKRAIERDARKAKVIGKKDQSKKEDLLNAIKERGIKLLRGVKHPKRDSDSEEARGPTRAIAELTLDGLSSQEATGVQVSLDEKGILHWPVLFLYPEHQQSDFISTFCENSCFLDHLAVMFGEELPPWDSDQKYLPQSLELFFEDLENQRLYQVDPKMTLLGALQHKRCFVKAGTPSFIVLVKGSSFCKQFLTGQTVKRL